MNRRCFMLLAAGLTGIAAAADDGNHGKDVIGSVSATVYYGTDADPAAAGPRSTEVAKGIEKTLAADPRLRFKHYRQLGKDVQPLYKSDENWVLPFGDSKEVMLRYEALSVLANGVMRLNLELWISRKRIFKTDAPLTLGKRLLVLGPEWRGGRLILAIELAPAVPKP